MKRRRTLIRSNADAFASPVLSPKRTIPAPAENTTGLILCRIQDDLFVLLLDYKPSFTAFKNSSSFCSCWRDTKGKLLISVRAQIPAISPFNGIYLKVSLRSDHTCTYNHYQILHKKIEVSRSIEIQSH